MIDGRYKIEQEYTGHISGKPQFVLRFCGEWLSASSTLEGAVESRELYMSMGVV